MSQGVSSADAVRHSKMATPASPTRSEPDLSSSQLQEVASEVLRLRLVQSQHQQLEAQLRIATDRLQLLPPEKVLLLRSHLETGVRPGFSFGTLGALHTGVDPDRLLGLMECLCVVCDVKLTSRRQDELISVTQWLLQDPASLIRQLVTLPTASAAQTRRLAPFLLSCDSSWRGQLTEAGQCYEALRGWLSSYYQFSLISTQIQATNEQLQKQERLLEELGRSEGSTGGASGFSRASPWKLVTSSGRRSPSVQSTSSARSQSPGTDRAATVGLRMSPRPSVGTLTRLLSREGAEAGSPSVQVRSTANQTTPRPAVLVKRTSSGSVMQPAKPSTVLQQQLVQPIQLQSQRSTPSRTGEKVSASAEPSPRTSGISGVLGSARASRPSLGAPPPNLSPRLPGHVAPGGLTAQAAGAKRQIVAAVKTRRMLSEEKLGPPGSSISPENSVKVLTTSSMGADSDSAKGARSGSAQPAVPMGSPRATRSSEPLLSRIGRSRSLQGIREPVPEDASAGPASAAPSVGVTPPATYRGSRPSESAVQQRLRASQITPLSRSNALLRTTPSNKVLRLSSGSAVAGPGGTPAGYTGAAGSVHRRPGIAKITPLALTARKSDAGSGGTGGAEMVNWHLMTSRSASALDTRTVPALLRTPVREVSTTTPRPVVSARR